MQNRISQLESLLNEFTFQLTEYEYYKNDDKFTDDPTKDDKRLLSEANSLLKNKLDSKQRIDLLYNLSEMIKISMNNVNREILNIFSKIQKDDETIVEYINELIEEIKFITTRKMAKDIQSTPKKKRTIQAECEDKIEELDKLKTVYFKSRYENDEEKEVEKSIEDLCKMKIKSVLFDSDEHNWCKNDSEFDTKVKGHKNVCVVIADTEENIFGGFVSKEIGIRKYHYDPNACVFSLMKNHKFTGNKYPIKQNCYDFRIEPNKSDILFGFGAEDKNGMKYYRDIVVSKKNVQPKNYCVPFSFDYKREPNPLVNDSKFEVARIVVYEMEENEEQKAIREKMEKVEHENDLIRWEAEVLPIQHGIEQITQLSVDEIIFDSETKKWNMNDSEFGEIIQGKKDIVIVVEDERLNLFGGYIGSEITTDSIDTTQNCCLFSLKKNNKFNPKRYDKTDKGFSYKLFSDTSEFLIVFGINEKGLLKDLVLFKQFSSNGYCESCVFDYKDTEYALTGKTNFNVKRILVYQMKEKVSRKDI